MQIKILATSDMHGYIMPTSYSEKDGFAFGTAKAATMLKKLRASAKGPVFQIENGDFIQGSPLSYYVRKAETHSVEAITKIINQMDYDVSILGNHEFNYGLDYLKETIASYQQPVLAANILGKDGQPYFGQPYVIIENKGLK